MILVEFEGSTLACEEILYEFNEENEFVFKNLKPGDSYIGKRNTDWKFGTVSLFLWESTKKNGWIYANENIYPFDVGECLKVIEII